MSERVSEKVELFSISFTFQKRFQVFFKNVRADCKSETERMWDFQYF